MENNQNNTTEAPEAAVNSQGQGAPKAEAPQLFASLNLAPALNRAVAEGGYAHMTPIQAKAIPIVLGGRDVMGAAQTGTGKTAAFSLPLLQRMMAHENASTSPARHPVRALVLAPTRELADQVAQSVKRYAQHTQLRCAVVFGGIDMNPQKLELRQGVEVLVATPGRLLDHIEAKTCVLNQVEYVVLDEADRMLDIGFLPDLQRILSYLPKKRQTLLFSATFSPEIKRLAESYLQNPVLVEVARPNATASTVEQTFYAVADDDKRRALVQLIQEREVAQAIVFVNSKLGCARLARSLERDGILAGALHGDKSQDERLKTLEAFKKGELRLLVATDVAARGLDIADLPAVFNYDIPFNAEDYVHRIGRTGRAGASGIAINFVGGHNDARLVSDIEKLIKKTIEVKNLTLGGQGFAPRRGHYNEGSRGEGRGEGRGDSRGYGRDEGKSAAPRPAYAAAAKPLDPFFSKPYEASVAADPSVNASGATPSPTHTTARRGNPYIKSKTKVAALFAKPKLASPASTVSFEAVEAVVDTAALT